MELLFLHSAGHTANWSICIVRCDIFSPIPALWKYKCIKQFDCRIYNSCESFIFKWPQICTLDLREVRRAPSLFCSILGVWSKCLLKCDPQSSQTWLLKYLTSWQAYVTGQVTLITQHMHTHRASGLIFIGQVFPSVFVLCSFISSCNHHLCLSSRLFFLMLIREWTVALCNTEEGSSLNGDETVRDSREGLPVDLRWGLIITAALFQQMNRNYNNAA